MAASEGRLPASCLTGTSHVLWVARSGRRPRSQGARARAANRWIPSLVAVALLLSGRAYGEEGFEVEEEELRHPIAPNISPELLDPEGKTRFHLTSRVTFHDGVETFSKSSLWSFEALAFIRIIEGLAITAGLPFGVEAPERNVNNFFVGNVKVGVAGGYHFSLEPENTGIGAPTLGVGGAFDIYAPTAPELEVPEVCGSRTYCDPIGAVRSIRSYEPELYSVKLMSFRLRAHVDFSINIIKAELEMGLIPGFTVQDESDFHLFYGIMARVSSKPIYEIEPYLELGSEIHLSGDTPVLVHNLSTPALLTIGARAHVFSVDPALFLSIDLKSGALIFGLDLAGAVRSTTRARSDRFMDVPDVD